MKIGNMDMYGVIYKITNRTNGKVYIGQTINGFNRRYSNFGKGIERVYNHHNSHKLRRVRYNKHLLGSIEKYGFDSFEICEVFDVGFSQDELNIKEETWISYYKSTCVDRGYNQKEGGNNKRLTEEIKAKIRLKAIGRKVSKKTRLKISANNTKPMLGRKHTKESKEKMSKSTKGMYSGEKNPMYGKKRDDVKVFLGRRVICLNTMEVFDTLKEAELKYGGNIYECCRLRTSCAGNKDGERLAWRYYDEYVTLNEAEIEDIIKRAVNSVKINSKRFHKKVICLNENKTFNSLKEASTYYNINSSSITQCCTGVCKSGGTHPTTKEKLMWKYAS